MSGEPIVLAGDVNGTAARLVETIARLAELNLGPYALVGGLAVMCRLAAVHRATQGIGTVTEATVPPALEFATAYDTTEACVLPVQSLVSTVHVQGRIALVAYALRTVVLWSVRGPV